MESRGIAPRSAPCHDAVLLLNDDPKMVGPAGNAPALSNPPDWRIAFFLWPELKLDARPGLAPGRSGLQSDGSSPLPCAQLNWGDQGDLHPPPRLSQSRMPTVTLWSPLKLDPPAGAAPASSALRGRCIADLCHGGIKMALPRGLAPRASAFAERRAGLLHFGSK